MEKYIGNKSSILPSIEEFIRTRAPDATSFSDLFSGTANVARYFSARQFDVEVCDVNRFTYVLAHAYIGTKSAPQFTNLLGGDKRIINTDRIKADFERAFKKSKSAYNPTAIEGQTWDFLIPLARVLALLQRTGEENSKPGLITDYFTKWGSHSGYKSARGTSGKRNYFSRENALFLDGVLPKIRSWWKNGRLTRQELFLLLTAVIEEIVITANVNGTFHDFNRNRIWPNALQPFFLRLPLISITPNRVGIAHDEALNAATYIKPHDICYLDPPYNFRQYTSYYHFLNFIAAMPFISNVRQYLSDLEYVRGQNMNDDYTSTFCSKSAFTDELRKLISRVPAKYVVLSYYNGRNHWNHWSVVDKPTSEGLHRLTNLFSDSSLFSDYEVVPAMDVRLNYQSRSNARKSMVSEYLFFGELKNSIRTIGNLEKPLNLNNALGISEHFTYSQPRIQQPAKRSRLGRVA